MMEQVGMTKLPIGMTMRAIGGGDDGDEDKDAGVGVGLFPILGSLHSIKTLLACASIIAFSYSPILSKAPIAI